VTANAIPNRAVFRSQEVCDIVQVQPYVLRSWEAEFPDLGMSKSADGPRVYRRADVERVLRLKHLLFVDGLTLAGARKQLSQEGVIAPAAADRDDEVDDSEVASMMDENLRQGLRDVRRGLGWVLGVLNGADPESELRLTSPSPRGRSAGGKEKRSASKPVRSTKPARRGKPIRVARRSKSAGKKKR
jgi:DNA-binding transcriptional MerR regulator